MPPRKNKKATGKSLISLVILAGLGMTAWWLFNREQPRFVRYPEFGIDIPANFPIHGIDVSRYQHQINWEEVKAMQVEKVEINFAFIKATEGIGKTDKYFSRNWKRAQDANMVKGLIIFSGNKKREGTGSEFYQCGGT